MAELADVRARAWELECFARERRGMKALMIAASVLYPGYVIVDHVLEPASMSRHWIPRIAGTVIFLAAVFSLHRARSLRVARATLAAAVMLVGPMVGWMLTHVEHFTAYLIGYTTFYWACLSLTWTTRWSVVVFGWQLAAIVVIFLLVPHQVAPADLLGGAATLVTMSVLTTIAIHGRWDAHRRAFEASYALAERNAELSSAMAQLREAQTRLVAQEKQTALGRLLAGLSHEINNPINVIKNNLDPVRDHVRELHAVAKLARSATAADLPAIAHEYEAREVDWRAEDLADALSSMATAVAHMLAVHADLRAFIRGDSVDSGPADVGAGLRATVGLLSRRVPPDVRVTTEIAALAPVHGKSSQLNQVWVNLLQNALDAVGPTGAIRVGAHTERDTVVVSVEDTGPGVAPTFRSRLFEPFATTKPPGSGTGLGLAISYQIIADHGGRMYLDDRFERGARFVVELPVVAVT